ncbi:MAG: F0F1 ATP synthase subunit epsilon [Candidatus Hydrogenedentes bacterium]|nr:F0F1 ATP synthase subunit epsilon [Candidatus Hydrogenedentota bacterium]
MPEDTRIQLEIVALEKTLQTATVDSVTIPGLDGDFSVLPGHTPFLSALRTGVMTIRSNGATKRYAVNGGYTEVLDNKVIVLTQTVEAEDEIDVDRAKKARDRAERRLGGEEGPDIDMRRAELALQRALIRLQATGQP